MKKKLIFSIIIVIIAEAGVLGYLEYKKNGVENPGGQTTEIDTSDWLTYRNEVIGIEFQHPSDWPILKPSDRDSFNMELVDLSHLNHYSSKYDNLPIDEQYKIIKCKTNIKTMIYCEEKVSNNGVKYVWKIFDISLNNTLKGGLQYYVQVATGKYILSFSFQDKDNYERRSEQYQKMLSTLKIPK